MNFTANKAYPYPSATDMAAGPAGLEALAVAADANVLPWTTGFTAGARPLSFLFRTTVDNSAIGSGNLNSVTFQTNDFNNPPAGSSSMNGTTGQWHQTPGEGACWWYFGWCLIFKNNSTPALGGWTYSMLGINDFNPATQKIVQRNYVTDNYDDVGTFASPFSGGMHFGSVVTQVSGSANGSVLFGNGDPSTTKFIAAGSTFYGFRIGGVAS